MSDFKVEVVAIADVRPHENADALDILKVFDFPVIAKRGEYKVGDLAAYVPVDAIVPDTDDWRWLNGGLPLKLKHARIKAKKLRGVFSMGLLVKPPTGASVGDDVSAALGIVKYEEVEPSTYAGGVKGASIDAEPDPGFIPHYTGIESLRRYAHILDLDEEVVITEKIHGANARYGWRDGRLYCGSHRQFKLPAFVTSDGRTVEPMWWTAAKANRLDVVLALNPHIALFGEVYGQVQDLRYNAKLGDAPRFRAFDAFDVSAGRYLDHADFEAFCIRVGIPMAPLLYRGPWGGLDAHRALADGSTLIDGADHMREGFVVRPAKERFDEHVGRVIFKLVGEGYLTRKGGSEAH